MLLWFGVWDMDRVSCFFGMFMLIVLIINWLMILEDFLFIVKFWSMMFGFLLFWGIILKLRGVLLEFCFLFVV